MKLSAFVLLFCTFFSLFARANQVEKCTLSLDKLVEISSLTQKAKLDKVQFEINDLVASCREQLKGNNCTVKSVGVFQYDIRKNGTTLARANNFSEVIDLLFKLRNEGVCTNSGRCEKFYHDSGNFGLYFPVLSETHGENIGYTYNSETRIDSALKIGKAVGLCF